MSANEADNPATWARQIRATVRFSDELDVLLAIRSVSWSRSVPAER